MTFADTLELEDVRLERFSQGHAAELRALPGDEAIFRFNPDDEGPYSEWIERFIAAAERTSDVIYIVRRNGRVVGSSRYLNLALEHKRLEIGGTFYLPEERRTHVNPVCKKLLLAQAFDALKLHRVELRCDARNAPSRGAIAKLGAKEEGVLRKHIVCRSGHLRDTVSFALLDDDWAEARTKLEARIAYASFA